MPWEFREGNDLFQPKRFMESIQEEMALEVGLRGQDLDWGEDGNDVSKGIEWRDWGAQEFMCVVWLE